MFIAGLCLFTYTCVYVEILSQKICSRQALWVTSAHLALMTLQNSTCTKWICLVTLQHCLIKMCHICSRRRELTEIDCVLCGKKKKDIVKKKSNKNNVTSRCECPDVSCCQPCKDDMKVRSVKNSNGIKPPYTYVWSIIIAIILLTLKKNLSLMEFSGLELDCLRNA